MIPASSYEQGRGEDMRQINVFDKGDEVFIRYEVDSLIFKNGTLYYKLKEPKSGTYLNNAYTADELIPAKKEGVKSETVI